MTHKLSVCAVLALLVACKGNTPADDRAAKPEPAATDAKPAREHRLTVAVDERVETISMLCRAANVRPYGPKGSPTPYHKAVDAKLAELTEHPAVATTAALQREHGISFNAPIGLAVYLDWPGLKLRRPLKPFPPHLDERWKGVDVDTYLEQVRDFADKAELGAFFEGQHAYFERVESALQSFVDDDQVVPWFETFFARNDIRHTLVQGLLTGTENYGVAVELPDGENEAYQVVVVWKGDAAGVPHPDGALLAYVVHEMAHSYVNPLDEQHADAVQADATTLLGRVADKLALSAYRRWDDLANESLVRATTRLYLAEVKAHEALAQATAQDEREGFIWVPDLVSMLDAARGDDFVFADHLADAAKIFARYAADDDAIARANRFPGPINGVYARHPTVVVAGAAAEYAEQLSQKLGHPTVRADAVESLADDRSWVLYGSPSSNPHVATLLKTFGWKIGATSIELGERRFDGDDLVLIAAHPWGHGHAALLYSAHDDATLVGINNLSHGGTDWVVAHKTGDSFEVVAQGAFGRDDDGRFLSTPSK